MRQSAQKVDTTPYWKQEVNRRIAERKERKGEAVPPQDKPSDNLPAGSVAASAVARVAARYAKTPSYSEVRAAEARAAVRAAEAASKAALEAQAAAESVLAGLEADLEAGDTGGIEFAPLDEERQLEAVAAGEAIVPVQAFDEPARDNRETALPSSPPASKPSFEIRWDADLPVRGARTAAARAARGVGIYEVPVENLRQQGRELHDAQNRTDLEQRDLKQRDLEQRDLEQRGLDRPGCEVVEAAQPIHANLIHFPKELIATRKVRPRRAEGPYSASVELQGQLSIFEVEPSAIDSEPQAHDAETLASAQTWVKGPKWSGIELDEEPLPAVAPAAVPAEKPKRAAAAAMDFAPLNHRILAGLVDLSLTMGVLLASVLAFSLRVTVLPPLKEIEWGSIAALAVIGVLYQAFFFAFSLATPGMRYARLEICTLAGKQPILSQRLTRAGAFVLSMLPFGLGAAWAVLDEENLGWHERLSGTYVRKA